MCKYFNIQIQLVMTHTLKNTAEKHNTFSHRLSVWATECSESRRPAASRPRYTPPWEGPAEEKRKEVGKIIKGLLGKETSETKSSQVFFKHNINEPLNNITHNAHYQCCEINSKCHTCLIATSNKYNRGSNNVTTIGTASDVFPEAIPNASNKALVAVW